MKVNEQSVTTEHGRFTQVALSRLDGPLRDALKRLEEEPSDRGSFVVVEHMQLRLHVDLNEATEDDVEVHFVQFCGSRSEGLRFDLPIGQLTKDESNRIGPETGERVVAQLSDGEQLVSIQRKLSDVEDGVRLASHVMINVMKLQANEIVTVSEQQTWPSGRN